MRLLSVRILALLIKVAADVRPGADGQERILEMFFLHKGAFIIEWGQDLWAERAALFLYKAGGYMLSVQGGRDMLGVLDHKCLLHISTHKTTFTRFLCCFSFSSILTMGEMYRQSGDPVRM